MAKTKKTSKVNAPVNTDAAITSVATTEATPVETATAVDTPTATAVPTTPVKNNTLKLTPAQEKRLKECIIASRGTSVNIARYMSLTYNNLKDEQNNNFDFPSLSDKTKNKFKHLIFEQYLNYDKSGFKKLRYCNILIPNEKTFNLKLLLEKYEMFQEETLIQLGLVDDDDNILDKENYRDIYNQTRLYLFTEEFKKQQQLGKLYLYEFALTNVGNNQLEEEYKASNPISITDISDKHKVMTAKTVQTTYENCLNIKFAHPMFEFNA